MESTEQCADCDTELIYQETCTQEMLYCPDCDKRYRPDDFFTDG